MSYKNTQRTSSAWSGMSLSVAKGDYSIEFYRALPEEFARGTIYKKLKNKGRVYEL